MAEYIERELAVKRISYLASHYWFHKRDVEACVLREAKEIIQKTPAVDVAPVVHAKNLSALADCDKLICSSCGIVLEGWYRIEYDEEYDDTTHYEYEFKFCPECGAKIKEYDE